MKKLFTTLAVLSALSTTAFASASEWGYTGETAPANWHGTCQSGLNQSPIDITNAIESTLKPITFNYAQAGKNIVNNGHTVQVNFDGKQSIQVEGKTFNLLQLHFHAPSENLIAGHSYPLEMHLVHADKDGNLAVIGVMFKEGKVNPELAKIWAQMPSSGEIALDSKLRLIDLLPSDQAYYRFNGSLTTPPCTEGVTWLVMKKTVPISSKQLSQFKALYEGNNRPVQATNARPVLK
ncbi:carbonic anhydrase family protein [Aliivibrio sp. S4TY2]|uniref:carbonic anhydrase n=1 Tax=unclassified Aliivibrio TaxID=2645654 RepID=UPI002378D256|nr:MULTISPECIES: carbonic anhydrase family protein [unclassified Aliivibrio]MDD9154570.1 carbonic anhydrase family protein [Aliivibrio sp. S4TY2]MDD9159067.1 carbonic anhydrase family protein [Aliivibrio sp. S4TY1]MDD9162573.1 carbonic anhydrase family protein [Aliivibrio sp. S4MY2]MDD9167066.1 carbonic anhydrase family protein [Aliivibrio sp. S4MY4]MDD9183650.1 carbonic anhydrase family protein [Aliivibrio sp. S4MY3]